MTLGRRLQSAYVAEPRTRSLKADRAGDPRKPRAQRPYPRRRAAARARRLSRRRARFPVAVGGTPANEDAAREAIGKLDLGAATAAGVAMLGELAKSSRGGKVGAVGFCWGGAYVNRLAVAAGDALDAGVVYYGPAPDPAKPPRSRRR